MKILEIVSGEAKFLNSKGVFENVIDIDKDDIYHLSDLILKNDVEMDVEDDNTNKILHEAAKIIYSNLRTELTKIKNNKVTLLTEIDSIFKEAEEQYKRDIATEQSEKEPVTSEVN